MCFYPAVTPNGLTNGLRAPGGYRGSGNALIRASPNLNLNLRKRSGATSPLTDASSLDVTAPLADSKIAMVATLMFFSSLGRTHLEFRNFFCFTHWAHAVHELARYPGPRD
jgi:hypothetical protein